MSDEETHVANLTLEILKNIQERMGNIEGRMGSMEARMGSMEARIGSMEGRIGGMDDRIGKLTATLQLFQRDTAADFAEVRAVVARLDANTTRGLEGLQRQLDGHRLYAVEKDRSFEERLQKLEHLQAPPPQP